jgi:hypothetical protein
MKLLALSVAIVATLLVASMTGAVVFVPDVSSYRGVTDQ